MPTMQSDRIDGPNASSVVIRANGVVWAGDPHLSSVAPARRLDDYTQTALDKLRFAVETAHDQGCILAIGGDLFTRSRDFGQGLLTRTLRVLRSRDVPILCVPGNHDIAQSTLTDDTSLAVLEASGVLRVIGSRPWSDPLVAANPGVLSSRQVRSAAVEIILIPEGSDQPVMAIGGTPYGQAIPSDLMSARAQAGLPEDCTLMWLTHADLDFKTGKGWLNMPAPHAIVGCDIVVNGHQHATEKPVTVGQTTWFNPGNLTRQSVDQKDHAPHLLVWRTENVRKGKLLPTSVSVPHKRGISVFDLTGTHIKTDAAGGVPHRPPVGVGGQDGEQSVSAFVRDLSQQQGSETRLTVDGSILKSDAMAFFEQDRTPEAVRNLFFSLLDDAAKARQKSRVEPA